LQHGGEGAPAGVEKCESLRGGIDRCQFDDRWRLGHAARVEQALQAAVLIAQTIPPLAGAAGQQDEADGRGGGGLACLDGVRNAHDLALPAFGVVDYQQQARHIAVGVGKGDELFERLPPLLALRLGGLRRYPFDKAGLPAVLLPQLGRDFDQQPRLAQAARAVQQAGGRAARVCGRPVQQGLTLAGGIDVADYAVTRLQQVAWRDVEGIGRQLAVIGVDDGLAVLAAVDLVQRYAGGERLAAHHARDVAQQAFGIAGVDDVVDVEGFGDLAEGHIGSAHIDQATVAAGSDSFAVDPVRGGGTGRPDDDDGAGAVQCRLDLHLIGAACFQLVVPPHRARAVLLLQLRGELACQLAVPRRIADEDLVHALVSPGETSLKGA
jgi:hypothetical protein